MHLDRQLGQFREGSCVPAEQSGTEGVEHSLTDFKHMVTRIDLYFRKFTLAAAEKIKQFGRKDLRKGNWRWVISYRLAEKMIRA